MNIKNTKVKKLFLGYVIGGILILSIFAIFSNQSPSQTVEIAKNQTDASNEILSDEIEIIKAKVLSVEKEEIRNVPGTDVTSKFQTIEAQILEGKQDGKIVTVENDHIGLKKGEKFYLRHSVDAIDSTEYYSVSEPYRLPQLAVLIVIFVITVFVFGGMQGIRGLLSLVGSLLLIVYVLLPGVLNGYSPILVATGVSSLIIVLGSYITHGFNKTTSSAVVGMVITVMVTGLIAVISVKWTKLSGFGSEEVMYLNLNSGGSIDVIGLLLGGIMIGLLGVLYDVAIGQAISVEELLRIAPHVPKKKIYERAIRIGREHIGALVNTLAIAYVGAALPLLLLFYMSPVGNFLNTANKEIFATEIVRTMIGSIGLVLAVPITTLISVWYLTRDRKKKIDDDEDSSRLIEMEIKKMKQITHAHGHDDGTHESHAH